MRCFVAIPLPADVRAQATAVQATVRRSCGDVDVGWTPSASLHVTIRFLGNVDPGRLPSLCEVLRAAAAAEAPPALSLAGIGAFPSARHARIVWVGVRDGTGGLARLADAIEQGLRPLGVAPEERPFTPHLTLGRVRAPQRGVDLRGTLATFAAATAGAWTPPAVVLYESQLGPAGTAHEVRAECPFA